MSKLYDFLQSEQQQQIESLEAERGYHKMIFEYFPETYRKTEIDDVYSDERFGLGPRKAMVQTSSAKVIFSGTVAELEEELSKL